MKHRETTTKTLVLTGMMTAVVAALSQISFPLPSGIPVTMQTFAVVLAACVLGWKRGTACLAVYILLGIVGVPVFAGFRGGPASIVGLTGGYIWGFLPMALLCGLANVQRRPAAKVVLFVLGLAACHVPGVIQFALLSGRGPLEAFGIASAPYLAKDLASVASAYLIARAVRSGLRAAGISLA